jgi:hypothetical protein
VVSTQSHIRHPIQEFEPQPQPEPAVSCPAAAPAIRWPCYCPTGSSLALYTRQDGPQHREGRGRKPGRGGVGRRKEERGKEGVTKSRREGKGRECKERNNAPATAVSASPPHQLRRIHLRPRRNNLASSVAPRCQTSALDKYSNLDQYPAGRHPACPDVAPISATTSRTTDCSACADDVRQPGRRHGIFKDMREEKSTRHPTHEKHPKDKGYPCAESGRSRREHLAQARSTRPKTISPSAALDNTYGPARPPPQPSCRSRKERNESPKRGEGVCAQKQDMRQKRGDVCTGQAPPSIKAGCMRATHSPPPEPEPKP